jgi:hypothetical protein
MKAKGMHFLVSEFLLLEGYLGTDNEHHAGTDISKDFSRRECLFNHPISGNVLVLSSSPRDREITTAPHLPVECGSSGHLCIRRRDYLFSRH